LESGVTGPGSSLDESEPTSDPLRERCVAGCGGSVVLARRTRMRRDQSSAHSGLALKAAQSRIDRTVGDVGEADFVEPWTSS